MRQPHDPSFLLLDSDDLSAVAFLTGVASAKTVAKVEGVPLAVANRVFGKDALKRIIPVRQSHGIGGKNSTTCWWHE